MSQSEFKNLQQEVCSPELEPPPLKKLCAPCVPNENYIEPDWEFVEIGEPYLNEKRCEYQITVTVNKFGDSFTAKEFREAQGMGRQASDGPIRGQDKLFGSREALLRSFIHPAIVLILEEYGKLVADQIICATFPGLKNMGSPEDIVQEIDSFEGAFVKLAEQEIDDTRSRCLDYGTEVTRPIDPTKPFDFQKFVIEMGSNAEIQNPFALELHARVNDFYIDPIEDIVKVHIGIPSFIVDQVPELPSKEELQDEAVSTREQVVLDVKKLFGQMFRLETSLQAFGKYQSYFYQTQDGYLKFKESKKDFYATRMSSKIGQFYSDLKQLGESNKVNLRSDIPSLTKLNADKVRIEFKTGPNGNPYVIKAVYAWKEGCEEVKLRKGIKKLKKQYDKRPTVMNYVAKLNDIDLTLQARETTPWLDFLVKYTYPLIIVDYGALNMQSVGDTLGKCVEENAREFGGELKDYILNETLSFLESLSFQYSSAASCEELYSTANQPEEKEFEDVGLGLGEGLEARKKVRQAQDALPDKVEDIAKKIIELDRRLTLIRLEIEKLEREKSEIEKNLDSGVSSQADLAEINKLISTVKKSQLDATMEKGRLNSKLRTLRGEDGEKQQKQKERSQRKAAAKKARRRAKNHPYTKKAAKIAMEEIKKSDTLLSSLIDWEKYEKEGKLTHKKLKKNKDDKETSKDILARLSNCGIKELTVNAVRCLFSGVTKERAFDKMFRAAMKAMDLDVFGFFIGGLPVAAQNELRKKIEEEFGNIPLPWEESYESGAGGENQYKSYLSSKNVPEKNTLRAEKLNLNNQIRDLKKAIGPDAFSVDDKILEISAKIEQTNDFLKSDPSKVPEMLLENAKSDLELLLAKKTELKNQKDPRIDRYNRYVERLEEIESEIANLPTDIGTGQDFKDLSDEEKKKLLEEQKKGQGTFGTALGNIQEEIVNAYIEYIFDVLNYEQIGEALGSVPGGTIVFNTLDQVFKCSTQGLFNPPLKSFMSSLSLDVCGEDRHIGIAVPSTTREIEMPTFSKAFFIKKLKNAFIAKVETVVTKVITMLLLKLFETIDNALCKSLNAIGQAAIGTITVGPGAGLDEAFADAFCPDADEDELNNVKKNAFGNALGKGAVPDSAYECLFKAINGTMSKREIIDLLTSTPSNMDETTVAKFALLVNSRCPELADLLGDAEDVKDAFGSMGKYIPPDLKDFLRNQPDDDLEAPIYDAICLTQDELDLWNANRKQLYLDNGLDEATADELINKANDRVLDNLGSLADIAQKGPQGLLGEAIDAILKQPECATDPGAIILEDEQLAQDKKDLMSNFFKRIESKFLDDLIGERSSLIGNILIDTQGNHFQQHNRRVNIGDRTFLFADYVDSEEQWKQRKEDAGRFKRKRMGEPNGVLPSTVGIHMLNELKDLSLKYKTDKDEPQLKMKFEATRDERFFDEYYKTVLNYKLRHNKKSTQRAFIRETIDSKIKLSPDTEVVLSTRRNQVFDDAEIGNVNYEVIPNEIKLFSDLLKKKSNSPTPLKTSAVIKLFDNLNTKALSKIRNAIIETPKGDIPVGFSFGYSESQELGYKDLLYVNPDADPNDEGTWDYTFEEEDSVLGKSATENPRVHFLDPAIHGGRYKYPKIYIEPATYDGWLGAIRTFVPQIQTCEDKDNGFLNMTEVANRAKQVESNVPVDSRLAEPLECRLEVPYDRQLMPANHGMMEGLIISAIRMYASEFIVRSFPVLGSIQFNSNNYDSLITKAMADFMQTEMSDAGIFANISRLAYYLLFLEQSVQVVQRQIIDGLMEETEEMREASKIINRAQNDYEKFKLGDISAETRKQISKGSRILAFGTKWEEKPALRNLAKLKQLNGYKINLARKVAVIHDTQDAAEVFLAALISKEANTLSKRLNLNLRPLPHVYDVKKYMLSTNGIVDQSDIKSGFATVEQEVIEGGSKPDYGSVLDCAGADLVSPLGVVSKTVEDIKKTGFMYLEKYVRVISKNGIEQVMKVSEFQQMISDRQVYDENMLISDYFGNAQIVANKLIGSIGVKFGVRLIMALPSTLGLTSGLDKVVERLPSSIMSDETKVVLEHIPVASYELDLIDEQIKEIDLVDPNLGLELKCYVDRLVETEDFKMLFDTCIKTRTFCSLFSLYSFQNFIEAVGKVEVEEENQRREINQRWKKVIFNDTKRIIRKQFRSLYNSQDDTESSGSRNRQSNINFLKNLIPDLYLNVKGVGFFQRLRIVDANPFDENGEPCVNEFQKLFED